jgi:hypothetical protein
VNKPTKIRRLTHLITVLERAELRDPTDPSLRVFNMNDWAWPTGCGTAACALGEAGFDPVFRKAGLMTETGPHGGWVFYKDESGFDAGAEFFGISYEDACDLFSPESYDDEDDVKPKHVIAKIEKLLAAIVSSPTHNQEPI